MFCIASVCGFAQPSTNSILRANSSNQYFKEFGFLPGGLRSMAATISATNENFRQAVKYIDAIRTGQWPPKLPDGVTQADVSNAYYRILIWPSIIPQRPINFYGKVVDENGLPVIGVVVHFEWDGISTNISATDWNETPPINKSAVVTSDAEGLFSLTNKSGTQLNVSVGKAGYYSSRRNRGADYFKYSQWNWNTYYGLNDCFKPDSLHPIIYYLRKMGVGANSLVTSQYGIRDYFDVIVPRDGTPVVVNLLNRKVGNGSLEIGQKKPDYPAHGGIVQNLSPSDYAKWISATNWSFTLKMNEGGFIEEGDEFPFSPPESGYQSVVTFNFQKGQTNWTADLKRDFYIKFGNPPLYGHLEVETSSLSGLGLPTRDLLNLIILSAITETKAKQVTDRIRIVLHRNRFDELDLRDVEEHWKE